jgi:hypothetical protein
MLVQIVSFALLIQKKKKNNSTGFALRTGTQNPFITTLKAL